MSGHSKWHNIKHEKGITDAKRGQIFTRHSKLITVAAREGGGDPYMNANLQAAIFNAKADNVPNSNIEKAIKKGTGEDKDGGHFDEVMYEAIGPAKTAIYIQTITDNKNRTITNLKVVIDKNGGILGSAGTIGWMFEKKGQILAKAPNKNSEEVELLIIDSGAEDFNKTSDKYNICTKFSDLAKVRNYLITAGFEIEKAEMTYFTKNPVKIDNVEDAQKVLKIMEMIEEDEDVANVYSNFEIAEDVLEKL